LARIPCSIEMYYKMVEIAAKYEISIAEVQVTLIRDSLEKLYGFGCKHKDIRISKQGTSYYCKRCWRFMKKMRRPNPKKYEAFDYFVPQKTFLELMREENDPLLGLQPDQRGGE